MRNRLYGLERVDCGDGIKYIGVYIAGARPQFEPVKSHAWWRCHGRAAFLWILVKLGRL